MIDIFLSRPTWIPEEYKSGLNNFLKYLDAQDLKPRTIGTTDNPIKAPLEEVIELMSVCHGAIILGYPQIEVTQGFVKGEPLTSKLVLPTEWNHIEAGLAFARNLPIILIHDSEIKRGVFDRGAANSYLYGIDLKKTDWALSDEISGATANWKPQVIAHSKIKIEIGTKKLGNKKFINIGKFEAENILIEIQAEVVADNKKPEVSDFLLRITWDSPYCPKCFRPLNIERGSWMAAGVQMGYSCQDCGTSIDKDRNYFDKEIKGLVRREYKKYYTSYKKKIEKLK